MDYSNAYMYNVQASSKEPTQTKKWKSYMVPLLWVVIFSFAIYYSITIVAQYIQISTIKANQQSYESKIVRLDNEIASLQAKINSAKNIDSIRYKASKQLNMIKRDEKEAIRMQENIEIETDNLSQEKNIEEYNFVAALKSIFNR